MFTISKEFTLDASHQLSGLPDGHKCARLHGHTYTVQVELAAEELDDVGMVLDYGELAPFKAFLDTELDHHHLNDVVPFNPTAEALARWLYGCAGAILQGAPIAAVRVYETPRTCAEYRP